MTISIVTSPESAIATLPDLVDKIRSKMDDDYDLNGIYQSIVLAEAEFNRRLRVTRETQFSLLDGDGIIPLPIDFKRLTSISVAGYPLAQMPLNSMRTTYGSNTGAPLAYALSGNRIILSPVGDATVAIAYRAKVPALTPDNLSNWLLEEHPSLYIRQTLADLFDEIGDTERATLNMSIANDLIESINMEARVTNYGPGSLRPLMNRPTLAIDY